jgi:hypothetical protein
LSENRFDRRARGSPSGLGLTTCVSGKPIAPSPRCSKWTRPASIAPRSTGIPLASHAALTKGPASTGAITYQLSTIAGAIDLWAKQRKRTELLSKRCHHARKVRGWPVRELHDRRSGHVF